MKPNTQTSPARSLPRILAASLAAACFFLLASVTVSGESTPTANLLPGAAKTDKSAAKTEKTEKTADAPKTAKAPDDKGAKAPVGKAPAGKPPADDPNSSGDPEVDAKYTEVDDKYKRDLKSADPAVRAEAAKAYADTNHPKAVKKLLDLIKEKERRAPATQALRYTVDEALGKFTHPKAVTEIRKVVLEWDKPEQIYDLYLVLKGFTATSTGDKAIGDTAEVLNAILTAPKVTLWQKAAALESIGGTANTRWEDVLFEYIKARNPLWDTDEALIGVTALNAYWRCYKPRKTALERLPALKELLQLYGIFLNDRIRYQVGIAFAKIALLAEPTEDTYWIEWYLHEIEMGNVYDNGRPSGGDPSKNKVPRRTDKTPVFIGMPAIGKRIVFCIDLSGSMNEELSAPIREQYEKARQDSEKARTGKGVDKDEDNKPDDTINMPIKTKLDMAKVELLKALNKLERLEKKRIKELAEMKKKGTKEIKTAGSEKTSLSDPYYFNIVTYSTKSGLLDAKTEKFTEASSEEIKRFKDLVIAIEKGADMTNIHGAISDASQITMLRKLEEDASVHPEALVKGADTVFFMTDGWASWCDDSTSIVFDKRVPNPSVPSVGDGKFIYADDILLDFKRLNLFRKMIVNTVGIGNHDRKLMRGIAEMSGGRYLDLSGDKPIQPVMPPPPADGEKKPEGDGEKKADAPPPADGEKKADAPAGDKKPEGDKKPDAPAPAGDKKPDAPAPAK